MLRTGLEAMAQTSSEVILQLAHRTKCNFFMVETLNIFWYV